MTLREKFISLVDNDLVKKSDAIILLEGDGLSRIQEAVELFNSGFAEKIVFSGGITNIGYGSIPFSSAYPVLIEAGIPHFSIIHENRSQNTREQAIEVIRMALKMKWLKLILVASHYHQYRAYLTFIHEIMAHGEGVIIYNSPARNLKWFEETGYGIRIEMLENEFERIDRYRELGHLVDYSDAINYQRWKEEQA